MPTDQSDPVAVLRREADELKRDHCVNLSDEAQAALANLERRQGREKRLEALVRRFLEDDSHAGIRGPAHPWWALVEAARKELKDG